MTPSEDAHTRASEDERRAARLAKVALSVGAVALAAVHVALPGARLDTIVLVLLGIAVVPWLSAVFESIDTPFGGVKYRELSTRLDRVEGEGASVRQVQAAFEARERVQSSGPTRSGDKERLPDLVAEYNATRDPRTGMPSGPARTQKMTRIVGEMIAAAEAGESMPVEAALKGADLGERLAAYAMLYTRPDPVYIIPLVDSVIDHEKKPFGQFWGLRAIARLLESAGPHQMDLNSARRLRMLQEEFPPSSDRMFELRRILEMLDLG